LPDEHNRSGIGQGSLIGGNLSIIQNLMELIQRSYNRKILFLEEVENIYIPWTGCL
jgi:muramoyltetrapeptide carboxypeptidase LdcA involved in peptidoglycan recycling